MRETAGVGFRFRKDDPVACLPPSPRARSNAGAGERTWEGSGPYFPRGSRTRSPRVVKRKPKGRNQRSRRARTLPRGPTGVPPARDSGAPGARKPHERRQQGPALTSGGSGYNGAAVGTMPPRAPERAAAGGGKRRGPKPGRDGCPPSLAPHGPPRRVGVGGCPGGGVWKEKRAKGRTYFPRGTRRQDSSSREVRV
ncbi:cuticle collagen 34-like [Nomascus leucogenys]|uniref:cuticle collagen 34-like n=1 Tax=Nomascus leucogenys TaxID=61853 RepID=UPI00122D743C|nr:cuticle collagen 34-like [Nomascus leucogenys]